MDLEKTSKFFSITVIPLTICACVELITYYSTWNIPILNYMSPTEILFSFIVPGFVFFTILITLFACSFVVAAIPILISKLSEKPKSDPEKRKQAGFLKKVVPIIATILLFSTITITLLQGIWFEYATTPTIIAHLFLLFFIVAFIHNLSEPKENATGVEYKLTGIFSSKDIKVSAQNIYISLMITFISASFFYGRYQAHQTVTKPVAHAIIFKDNSIIQTDSNLIYLGKTNDYYFLYNKREKQSSVYPASDIKQVNIGVKG